MSANQLGVSVFPSTILNDVLTGDDLLNRPTVTWCEPYLLNQLIDFLTLRFSGIPSPIVDVLVVDPVTSNVVPTGAEGELWM